MKAKPETQENNDALERWRIIYLLAEAVEKLVRLQQVLVRQQVFVEADHKESGYAGVINPLLLVLSDQAERLSINAARIASFVRGEALGEEQRTALAGIIQTVINVVLTLHELLVLLPREAPEPQVFLMLRDCFKDKWQDDTSVIMTNALISYEYRIVDVLEKLEDIGQHELTQLRCLLKGVTRASSVLAQAFVDRDNPLAWAVLAHEYGHALDEAQGISRQIVHGDQADTKKDTKKDPQVKWISEVFADFVAARVLGPASQMPVLLIEMTRPLARASNEAQSHPPASLRLRLVREYLKQLDVSMDDFEKIFAIYEFDYAQKLLALDRGEQEEKDKFGEVVGTFLRSHFEAVASKVNSLGLRPFKNRQLEHAKTLQKKLESDLPISSLRQTSNDQILLGLNSLVESKALPEQVYEVLSQFNEIPATSSEILTAGWLYRLASFEDPLKKSFPDASSPHSADLDKYAEYLARTDELLLRSIELRTVHAQIIGEKVHDAALGN
jgi:hypothetical protein